MSEWEISTYASGTITVQNPDYAAHFGIAYRAPFGDTTERERFGLAHDIAACMNAGAILADYYHLVRLDKTRGSRGGIVFEARGPMIDMDPPNLHWVLDISCSGALARVKLFDLLFNEAKTDARKK